jgi:hypothetical protein
MRQIHAVFSHKIFRICLVVSSFLPAMLGASSEAQANTASLRMTAEAPVVCRLIPTETTTEKDAILVSLSSFCNAKHAARAVVTAEGYGFEDAVFTMDGETVSRNADGTILLYQERQPGKGNSVLRIGAQGVEGRNVSLRVEVSGIAY